MLYYLWGFVRAISGGLWWWVSLVAAWVLGVGIFSQEEYATARERIADWLGVPVIPETFPIWLFGFLFLIWACVRLAHREAMRHWRSARLVFGKPYVDSNVPLYETTQAGRRLVGRNEIAKIKVQNIPYDGEHGKTVEQSYARLDVYNPVTKRCVLAFDYPRWEENPKPGYQGNPADHYPHDWNRRALLPNGEVNTLNFLLKSIDEDCAYGFRGRSQLASRWRDDRLKLASGEYAARLTVSGVGLRQPFAQWIAISFGAGRTIDVDKMDPLDLQRWP